MKSLSSIKSRGIVIVACLFAALIFSYLYLHYVYKGQPYFWLHSNGLFAEVVYWSLFGSLTHILISLSSQTNNNNNLSSSKTILIKSLQVFVAPVFAIILFIAVFYFNEEETFDNSFLLLSFVAGLLSWQLLLLFKPLISSKELAVAGFNEPLVSEQTTEEKEDIPYGLMPFSIVVITLVLNDAGLFFDEKKEIAKKGFDAASVSIQKNGKGDIINALKIGEGKKSTFIADELEQGQYIVRAMQSLRLNDNSMLNLFGEQEIIVNDEEVNVVLPLSKLDA